MNRQSNDETLQGISMAKAQALIEEKYGESYYSLDYWAWPRVYGSTAGPFGGVGGAAMTTFTVEAWTSGIHTVIFCKGRVLGVREDKDGFDIKSVRFL